MSKIWDEREKSLENEYFRRKEQELVEKLRAQRAEKEKAPSIIQCPKCGGTLIEHEFEGVQIDRCNKCNGIWLDAGELELLTLKQEQSEGWMNRMWHSLAGK